jgi:hypothetical protein
MQWWVSEPGITWNEGGFGYNVTNDGGAPAGFGRPNTGLGQAYIRFTTAGHMLFYNTNTSGTRFSAMDMYSSNFIFVHNYLEAGGSLRAPIFFDSNNTGFFVDPSGTTNLNVLQAATANITAQFARWADVAEKYEADAEYEPGTVLSFGGDKEVTISTESHCSAVAGVVSTKPALLMNNDLKATFVADLALTGRVPCKVLGPVRKGQMIVASHIPGVGMGMDKKLYEPGCIIGKSIEAIEDSEIKVIEVVVGRM